MSGLVFVGVGIMALMLFGISRPLFFFLSRGAFVTGTLIRRGSLPGTFLVDAGHHHDLVPDDHGEPGVAGGEPPVVADCKPGDGAADRVLRANPAHLGMVPHLHQRAPGTESAAIAFFG